MKREAVGHTKMKRLCRRLDIPLWQGIGILESLWHITGRECPRGDIGRLSNEDIALAMDYCGDEEKLIGALVSSGWLDADESDRLLVHDWWDHADDHVHRRVARLHLYFPGGRIPKMYGFGQNERARLAHWYETGNPDPDKGGPEVTLRVTQNNHTSNQQPVTSNQQPVTRRTHTQAFRTVVENRAAEEEPEVVRVPPPPNPTPIRASSMTGDESHRWDEFRAKYPRKARMDMAAQQFLSVVTVQNEALAFACLERYLASDEVSRNVVMNPDNWLREQYRDGWKAEWPRAPAKSGADAIADIRRGLREKEEKRVS